MKPRKAEYKGFKYPGMEWFKIITPFFPFKLGGGWHFRKKVRIDYLVNEDLKSIPMKIQLLKNPIKCKKTLYKSTYGKNAFTKNREYFVDSKYKNSDGDKMILIIDNEGNLFDFSLFDVRPYYFYDDYFYSDKKTKS